MFSIMTTVRFPNAPNNRWNICRCLPYLDAAILPGEENNDRQTAYDDAGQDEYRRAHYPVQGHNTGTVILAGFAALRTL
jgi:hypothetical protein